MMFLLDFCFVLGGYLFGADLMMVLDLCGGIMYGFLIVTRLIFELDAEC